MKRRVAMDKGNPLELVVSISLRITDFFSIPTVFQDKKDVLPITVILRGRKLPKLAKIFPGSLDRTAITGYNYQ